MKIELTPLGTFKNKSLEARYLQSHWEKNTGYTFLTYGLCCFFLIFAGVFGDVSRTFYYGSFESLMSLRVGLFIYSVIIFFTFRKSILRPTYLEPALDVMKYWSTVIIILMTYWTNGTSLTLLPGSMMMLVSFYMILPGNILSTSICAVALVTNLAFLQDPTVLSGDKNHIYMTFMLFVIALLMAFFKVKFDIWARIQFKNMREITEMSQSKDRILEILAHDLNKPLSSILNNTSLSSSFARQIDEPRIDSYQANIRDSVDKIHNLLTDLIFWATKNLESGGLIKSDQCVSKAVEMAHSFVKDNVTKKRQTLLMDVQKVKFNHDTEMIGTCIRHLLMNANKFSPVNSTIQVSAKNYDDVNVSIKITDQAQGLSQETIDALLSRNVKLNDNASEFEQEVKKSLYLVNDVIKKHDGTVQIESNGENFTTFELLIPLT